MSRALTAPPRSTSVERALMKELLPVVGDRTLARRLVRAGIQGADGARALAQIPGGIDAYEAGARLGGSLRSVLAAGDRVIELTQSLKGYARPDAEDLKPVDVREGIDDVLRLTAHRVRGIRIDCDYEDVPPVCAHPAKLQQVWTNLIVNVLGDFEPDLVPELFKIALECVAHVRFVLKGQDCQGHDSSSCDWAGNEIRMIVDPG